MAAEVQTKLVKNITTREAEALTQVLPETEVGDTQLNSVPNTCRGKINNLLIHRHR